MFIAALFTIAKIWKQPVSSTDQWIKKMWCIYIYNGILLSHKKNEILPFATTWINLESVILSKMSERERQILYDITYILKIQQTSEYNKNETDSQI